MIRRIVAAVLVPVLEPVLSLVLSLALASCASQAPPPGPAAVQDRKIHALIVGIDRYAFSRDHTRGADFSDLKGAVGDTRRFSAAITSRLGVSPAAPSAEACPGPGPGPNTSTQMLLNQCATRAAILAALDAAIDARGPGETLLFYFAGHGSRYRDDETHDQDTGYNGTILPYDARNPDGSPGDIFDVELKTRKDRAVAKGVYFVTVFDSCNSATATRDGAAGQARSVPKLTRAGPPPGQVPPAATADGGYWVHLAAAQDGEEAQETPSGTVGERAGVFTSALIDTLGEPGMSGATFGDIIREVQLRVAQSGHAAQTPSAEGRLTASFGARSRSAVLFAASVSGGMLHLQVGQLSGITVGSTFALYPDQAAALAHSGLLGSGSVASVSPVSAVLTVTGAPRLPASLVAEETAHYFPPDAMAVRNDVPAGTDHDLVAAALDAAGFAAGGGGGATHVALVGGKIVLRAEDGSVLTDTLGKPGDAAFADNLRRQLQKVARARQLLALRTATTSDGVSADAAPLDVCIAADGYRVSSCPPPDPGGVRKLADDGRFTATIINRGIKPVYVYLLAIDPRNAVNVILPVDEERDQKLRVGAVNARARKNMSFKVPGAYRFVAIASDTAIRADAFEQTGNGTRDIAGSPLERLLTSASLGTRDVGVTAVGDWSAQISTVIVQSKPAR